MMTVITTMKLQPGAAPDCDGMIHERFQSAHGRPGWISGQLLTPVDLPDTRVIVGTWRSREDWEAWHDDPAFLENRNALERLQAEPNVTAWYEVVDQARVGGD
jgi:heme-degrading monooxygenase HmoA